MENQEVPLSSPLPEGESGSKRNGPNLVQVEMEQSDTSPRIVNLQQNLALVERPKELIKLLQKQLMDTKRENVKLKEDFAVSQKLLDRKIFETSDYQWRFKRLQTSETKALEENFKFKKEIISLSVSNATLEDDKRNLRNKLAQLQIQLLETNRQKEKAEREVRDMKMESVYGRQTLENDDDIDHGMPMETTVELASSDVVFLDVDGDGRSEQENNCNPETLPSVEDSGTGTEDGMRRRSSGQSNVPTDVEPNTSRVSNGQNTSRHQRSVLYPSYSKPKPYTSEYIRKRKETNKEKLEKDHAVDESKPDSGSCICGFIACGKSKINLDKHVGYFHRQSPNSNSKHASSNLDTPTTTHPIPLENKREKSASPQQKRSRMDVVDVKSSASAQNSDTQE
ncbi:unnamed protein product [Orchesella dallaii]|uniref:Uncharacterized protein n=1 Tax=Orchesella dallaii TaxID=48710 RepID=A0ABP1QQU4_9HEXA